MRGASRSGEAAISDPTSHLSSHQLAYLHLPSNVRVTASERNTEASKVWKRDSTGASYPEWEGGAHKSDANRRPVLLGDHRENWGALEEVREFAEELAMRAWKEDGFE